MTHRVVMVTTSYPRFPGDSVGTFMEPIARAVAARGHRVDVVAPWHPLVRRPPEEAGVRFHFYRYAPHPSLNVFGYAAAMRADVRLKAAAYVAAPLALTAGWYAARSVARQVDATVMHGHWVVPGGVTAAFAAAARPLVISLHGSDVYVAETLAPARAAARMAFRRAGFVTACSDDLARRAAALGADSSRLATVPYGVDVDRFRPDAVVRERLRTELGLAPGQGLVFAAGRLVRKKGFEYLVAALPTIANASLAIAGAGTLDAELRDQARVAGMTERVTFLGDRTQEDVARYLAAADVVVVPSIRDDSGNVDGLPNVVLEALASGTPLVTTAAGGIGTVVADDRTALVVPERDPAAIGAAVRALLRDRARAERLGAAGRMLVERGYGWDRTAEQFELAYDRALAFKSMTR
jgi:glycosyltransferase involved in cell wall biosynthesis